MPWWVWPYVLLLVLAAVLTVFVGREYRPRTLVVLDLATHVALIFFVLGYYDPTLLDHWGRGAAILYLATIAALGISHHWDLAILPPMPEMTETQQHKLIMVSTVVGLAIMAPAIGLGALLALRSW